MNSLEEAMPQVFAELVAVYQKLEAHYRDMQDLEFTVERGKLYMLQTRNGKRTAKAALKIAVDMAGEGLITQDEAVLRVDPMRARSIAAPDHRARTTTATSSAVACRLRRARRSAKSCSIADEAERLRAEGDAVILVREETSPEDIHGMHASQAIVTARGGMTSHAAVVARGMGRPCVSGAGDIRIDMKARRVPRRAGA